MNIFKNWLNDKVSLFLTIIPAFSLSTVFQYNWALSFGWDYFIMRVVFSGIVFILIFSFLILGLSYLLDKENKQNAIRKFSLANLVLLISLLVFFLEQLRHEILFTSIVFLFMSYLFVLLLFSKKAAAIVSCFYILAGLLFTGSDYFKVKLLKYKILSELKLVTLKNCKMKRFGRDYDGGYLLCANLLSGAQSAYSYGIAGRDSWGCDVSTQLDINIHQYDCFDINKPLCKGGRFIFHPECIGPKKEIIDDRKFDTLENQIKNSKETGEGIIIKMDIEGAEWDSLLSAPKEVLQNIDQLVIEFHSENNEKEVKLLKKLNQYFYPINLHYNNNTCQSESHLPLPARVYEVLYVNQRIGVIDEGNKQHLSLNPLDMPNNPDTRDCQLLQHQFFTDYF